MGQLFITFIVTKVTQNWFPDDGRMMATTIMAFCKWRSFTLFSLIFLSLSCWRIAFLSWPAWYLNGPGDGAGSGDKEGRYSDPQLRLWWNGHPRRACYPRLCHQVGEEMKEMISMYHEGKQKKKNREGLCSLHCHLTCHRSRPPTPPSRSAEQGKKVKVPYLHQLRDTFTCLPFLGLLIITGIITGYFLCITTLSQQMLCSIGYHDVRIITLNIYESTKFTN